MIQPQSAPAVMTGTLGRTSGWIEIIVGSMFSGKTQELIRRLRLADIAKQKVQVFSSVLDDRYAKDHIVSHDKHKIPCLALKKASEVLKSVKPETQVVGIDEVQFFDDKIVEACESLADKGLRVIVAGLDQDFRGEPFMVTARLMSLSEFVTKNLAICSVCGNFANRTQRTSISKKLIEVGALDKYEARCRSCFQRPK